MVPLGTKAMLSIAAAVKNKGKVMTFTSYWEHDEGITMDQASITGIADDFFTKISNLWKPIASDEASMVFVHAVYLKGDVYADGASTGAAVPGDLTAPLADAHAAMGDEVCVVLQRRTGKRGRSRRGRMFVPGIGEKVNNNGYISPDYETAVDGLAGLLGADVTIGGASPAAGTVWHARHYISPKTTDDGLGGTITIPGDFMPLTDVRYVNKLGTRKDRIIRGAVFAK